MAAIKSSILRIWDDAPPPVRICCVKFAQRVVLAQTASNGMEQRVCVLSYTTCDIGANGSIAQQSGLDVSSSIIPPNHAILDPLHLEAEATGLLDRMLGTLQDNSR